ncbi:MAG TPA: GDSL-type esterase/lipase family protein [Acidimicrobiales bacterium]|nr:GDSL-type esterase/lipase family protein [Acidimicrobiales bacterium]
MTTWLQARWAELALRDKVLIVYGAYVASVAALALTAQLHEWRHLDGAPRAVVPIVGAVVLVAISWILNHELNRLRRKAVALFIVISLVVTALGAVVTFVWFVGENSGVFGFAGLVAFFFGLGQLVGTLRAWESRPARVGAGMLAGCGVIYVVGLVVLTLDAPTWSIVALIAGVLATPIAMSLLTDDALRHSGWLLSGGALWTKVAVGGGVLSAGVTGLVLNGATARYVVVIAVILVLLIGAVASQTDTDVVVVLVAVALVWALAPRGVEQPDVTRVAKGDSVFVALGDSYISGEGARRFQDGTNIRHQNECRRAPTAYPVLLAQNPAPIPNMPKKVLFLACSGAKTADLYDRWQYDNEPLDGDHKSVEVNGVTLKGQLAQLVKAQRELSLDIKFVMVSIGGNDAQFGDVGKACLAPGDCSQFGQLWLNNLIHVEQRLYKAYDMIRLVVPAPTPILVIPYPIPLRETTCAASLLSAHEHRFLSAYATELDWTVYRAAAAKRVSMVENMSASLEDRSLRICDAPANRIGVNFLAANPVVGLLGQQVSPTNWFHNSLHPNERGHAALFDSLRLWIQTSFPTGPHLAAYSGRSDVASIGELMGIKNFKDCTRFGTDLAGCRSTTGIWTVSQVAHLTWYVTLPIGLVVAGAWVLWVQFLAVRRVRALFRFWSGN